MMRILQVLGLRGIVFIIIAAIAVGLYVNYKSLQHEVKNQGTAIVKKDIQIASQGDTIVTDAIVKKLDEDTQVAVRRDEKAVAVKHEQIQHKVNEQEHVIRERFFAVPPTVDNLNAEQAQLSESRIDALWEAYCAAAPAAAPCQPTKG